MAESTIPEIGLVSCVDTKREGPAPPRELYISDYFRKMRSYAEEQHDDWWILSARHGLLEPEGEPIEPYNETLKDAGIEERQEWAERVHGQMQDHGLLEGGAIFVVHAGEDYYGELQPLLEQHDGVSVELPTKGLRFGETISWYKERLE